MVAVRTVAADVPKIFQCQIPKVTEFIRDCHTIFQVEDGNPHVVWSASEDGTLRQHDFREGVQCPPPGSGDQDCRNILVSSSLEKHSCWRLFQLFNSLRSFPKVFLYWCTNVHNSLSFWLIWDRGTQGWLVLWFIMSFSIKYCQRMNLTTKSAVPVCMSHYERVRINSRTGLLWSIMFYFVASVNMMLCFGDQLDLRNGHKRSLSDPPKHCLYLKTAAISPTRPHLLLIGGR